MPMTCSEIIQYYDCQEELPGHDMLVSEKCCNQCTTGNKSNFKWDKVCFFKYFYTTSAIVWPNTKKRH